MQPILCRPKSLPLDKLEGAERRALELNPANAVERSTVARTPTGRRGGPRRIAVLVGRKWPASGVRLSVAFMDSPPTALRSRILQHMNAWGKSANVAFTETRTAGQVRIARLDSPANMAGYWSYIGTEILDIDGDQPTLNLEGFTMKVSEAEFKRVVRHETGHTLGFEHEHMRSELVRNIDRKKAIAYFDKTQGWSADEVDMQVLTPLARKSIMGTLESDPLSIMCYQLPAAIMKKGRKAIAGGRDINPKDYAFAAMLYPRKQKRVQTPLDAPSAAKALPTVVAPTHRMDRDAFHLVILDDGEAGDRAGAAGRETAEFARVLASYGGARVMASIRLRTGHDSGKRGGEGTAFGRIIEMHERMRAYTNRERGSLPTSNELVAFGKDLFETLFQGDVRRLYDEARVRERRRLDLVFTSMIPWIAEKPWEFAYDPGRKTFLATEEAQFIRNVLTNIPADAIQVSAGPLRILVASAQPVGFGRLSIEQEVKVIRRGFQPLVDAGHATIDVVARATPRELHGYLSTGNYQIAHFIGHGVYDEQRREGCLIFETERGRAYPLGEREAREIFCGRGLSLVFLNACETGRGGRADFNKGIAQSFVQHGLPAVVANQYTVLDPSATAFAKHFYWSLAQGLSLGQAAREARIAVNYSMHGEAIDWAIPVLYARDASATLCHVPIVRSPVPVTTVRPISRWAIAGRDIQIAVWDVDVVFPALETTLEAMNDAQSVFGFELVNLSAPLDAWNVAQTKDGTTRLQAERLAARLRDKPAALHVDILACLTRHWMDGAGYENLYGWWDDPRKSPIMIFSAAGFDELQPEGRATDRVIANAVVTALACAFGGSNMHVRRSPCPLWFNKQRDFGHLAQPQRFDRACRNKLSKRLGKKLDALDALLRVFDAAQDT